MSEFIGLTQETMDQKIQEVLDFINQGGLVTTEENDATTQFHIHIQGGVYDTLAIYKSPSFGLFGYFATHHREVMLLSGVVGSKRIYIGYSETDWITAATCHPFSFDGLFAVHTSHAKCFNSGFFISDLTEEEALALAADGRCDEVDSRPAEMLPEDYYAL